MREGKVLHQPGTQNFPHCVHGFTHQLRPKKSNSRGWRLGSCHDRRRPTTMLWWQDPLVLGPLCQYLEHTTLARLASCSRATRSLKAFAGQRHSAVRMLQSAGLRDRDCAAKTSGPGLVPCSSCDEVLMLSNLQPRRVRTYGQRPAPLPMDVTESAVQTEPVSCDSLDQPEWLTQAEQILEHSDMT